MEKGAAGLDNLPAPLDIFVTPRLLLDDA
jgi:hypothetical protein